MTLKTLPIVSPEVSDGTPRTQDSVSKQPRVLIIGGGLGGLALAQALRKQGITYQVFERDHDLDARMQGWAVILQWILPDLLSSLPHDLPPFEDLSVSHNANLPAEHAFINGLTGERIGGRVWQDSEGNDTAVRVNRIAFRKWLALRLNILWNKVFSHYEEVDGFVTAHFTDGTSYVGDVLVGADGINSKVRTQLLAPDPPKPNNLPIAILAGQMVLTKEQYTRQLRLANSFYLAYDGNQRIFVGLIDVAKDQETANYFWQLSWVDPAVADFDTFWTATASKAELLKYVQQKTEHFCPEVREAVAATKEKDMHQPPFAIKDSPPRVLPKGRVTLLGDSAHGMTFFRGQGANHALQDALHLARAVNFGISMSEGMKAGRRWDAPATLKKYEEEMIARTEPAVMGSREQGLDVSMPTADLVGLVDYQGIKAT